MPKKSICPARIKNIEDLRGRVTVEWNAFSRCEGLLTDRKGVIAKVEWQRQTGNLLCSSRMNVAD